MNARPHVYVKVVGFRHVERHAIHALFRMSVGRTVSYGRWSQGVSLTAQLVLLDLDAHDAAEVLAECLNAPHLRVICVGAAVHAQAHYSFQRPLCWPDVVSAMDSLFLPGGDTAPRGALVPTSSVPALASMVRLATRQGPAPTLLIHPQREDRLYLRARLALAGLTDVDEVADGTQAVMHAHQRRYRLLIVGLDLPDVNAWELVRRLVTQEPVLGPVLVISADRSAHLHAHARRAGCAGVLEKPYNAAQLMGMLEKI